MPLLKPKLPSLHHNHPLARGLIFATLMYEGGEENPPNALDLSLYKRHSIGGTEITWVFEDYGLSLNNIDGSGRLSFPSIPTQTHLTAFVVVRATANVSTDYNNDGVIGQWGSGGNAFTIWTTTSSGALDYTMLVNNGSTTSSAGTSFVRDNNWHTVCGTFDGASKIFIDGDLKATGPSIGGTVNSSTNELLLFNYSSNAPGNLGLRARIAAAYVYNRALSAKEIGDLHIDPFRVFRPQRARHPVLFIPGEEPIQPASSFRRRIIVAS